MTTRIGVGLMTALLAIYLGFAVWYAIVLLRAGGALTIAFGVALLVLPLIGGAFIAAEIVFGVRAERLAARLEAEGGLPDVEVALTPSGRPERAAADAVFPRFQRDAQEHPEDWRVWFRLGIAYDAAGDRSRARAAVRRAIRLSRTP